MATAKERYDAVQKKKQGENRQYATVSARDRYRAVASEKLDLDGVAKSISARMKTWLRNHNTYLENYNDRYAGRKGNYEDAYVSDSGQWADTVGQQKRNFEQEAQNIMTLLDQYDGYFSKDWADSIRNTLQQASIQQGQIVDVANGDLNFFNQFADESQYGLWQTEEGYRNKYSGQSYEDIVAAMEGLEAGQERDWLGNYQYEALQKAEDFDQQSRYANEEKGIGKYFSDPTYEFINGRLNHALYNALAGVGADFKYDKMTEDEVAIYNYFYAKEGKEKADAYLKSLNEKLVSREKQEIQEDFSKFSKENPVLASVASVPLSLLSGYEFSENALKYIAENAVMKDATIDQSYTAQASGVIRGTVAEQVDWQIGNWDAFDFVYNTAMSGADSLVGGLAFGNLGGAVLGLSAAAQATNDALERGMSDGQAFWNGLMSGVFEGLFETVSIGKFHKLKEIPPGSVKEIIKNLGKSMLVNASEEALTELANITYDTLINGEFANYTWEELKNGAWQKALGQVIEAGASGALMGLGMGGVGNAIGYGKGSSQAKKAFGSDPGALVGEALEANPGDSFAQKMQGRLDAGKNLSGGQLLRLNSQVEAGDMRAIRNAAAQRLQELGEKGDVNSIAQALARQAAGEKLSQAEKRAVSGSKYGSRVANELRVENIRRGGYSSEWAQKIGTQRINAQEYGRLLRAAEAAQEGVQAEGGQVAAEGENRAHSGGAAVSEAENTTAEQEYTGMTMQVSTGREVTPKKIASIEGGRVMIQTDSGTVAADDIEFGDHDTDLLWRNVADISGITTAGANGIIHAYNGSIPVAAYFHGAAQEFRNGYNNLPSGGEAAERLSPAQRAIIYKLGQKAAGENIAREQAKLAKTRKEKAASEKKVGKVHFDRKGRSFDAVRESGLKAMEMLSKALGVEFYVFESYRNEAGQLVYRDQDGVEKPAPNGFYDPSDGSIHIDLNAGNDGKGTMLFTIAHELTHFIRQWSPAKFKVLANFLVEQYGEKGVSVEDLVQDQRAKAEKNGRTIDYDTAFEEVVADSMEAMLTDGNVVQMMAELKQRDESLWQRICQWFRDLVEDLKAIVDAYSGHKPDSAEGKLVSDMQDVIGTLEQLYAEALVEAGENFQAAGAEKNTTPDGGVKHQARASVKDPRFLDPRTVTKADVVEMLNNVLDGKYYGNTYIPLRIGTPAVLIHWAEKRRGDNIDNNPIAMSAEKAYQAMARKGQDVDGRPHELSADDIVAIVESMSDPEYIVYQGANGRYVEVVSYDATDGKKALAVLEIGEYKPQWTMNGYEHGMYNILVTTYPPDKGVVSDLLRKKTNQVIYDKKKDAPRGTPGSTVPSVSNDASFFDDSVPNIGEVVNSESIDAMDIEMDATTESVAPSVMYSERTWTESDYVQEREKAAAEIANAIGVSKKKAKDYIDSINSIAKMIAEDRSRLDYFSSPGRTSFVGNVEYGGSFDFSTLCKKRRLLTGTFTAIQKALPNTALTADEILKIRGMMKEAGLEVSCGLCYVEGSRANMGQFAKEFLRLYKQYYPDAWQPTMADVNTPDGIEWVRINHPECYEQYEYFWNHYGTLKEGDKNLFASQQKPKLYQLHTEYKGEILQKFKGDENVEEKNLNGGIRLQSFSDFEIVHLIDTMQIIMDMSRVGLAGQAYTKVPDFAWALGDTGLKINLSLIAKGVDSNGKLIFDDVEGMPIADAMKLRDRYSKNVGTILVAFNDEQLLAAMADERVDFIIPFHRSQWKKSQYEAMGLPTKTKDYTYMQNEKFIKPQYHEYRGRMVKDKAVNYMPNEYWDFSKSGKENAEYYLELCARNNKRPKFYKLLENNGDGSYSLKADGSTDGYWKLLIDFKMYDNEGIGSPQLPVKPEFNMDEAKRMLSEYSGGHSNFPVAQGIVDSFVKEYKESHEGMKFSERDMDAQKVNQVLEKENDKLREDVTYLKELLKLQKQVTGGTKFTKTSVEAMAGQLKRSIGVTEGDRKELAKLLNSLYEHIAGGEEPTWESVKAAAQPAVDWLSSKAEGVAYGTDQALFAQDVLRQVYDSYWKVSTLYPAADKNTQKEISKRKLAHAVRMEALQGYHAKETAKLKTEHLQALEKVKQADRERLEKALQQTRERYQQSKERNAESRKKAEMRRKIRKTIMDLGNLLNKGDKKRNVKEGMKDFVSKALASAEVLFMDNYSNEDMVRYGVQTELTEQEEKYMTEAKALLEQLYVLPSGSFEAYQQRQEREAKLKSQIAYRMGKLQDVFVRERARLNKVQINQVLGDLADAYAKLQQDENGYVSEAYQENVYQYLLMLKGDVGGTAVKDMSLYQLEELHKAYTMVLSAVRNANRMFAQNLSKTREELGKQTITEVKLAGGNHGLWLPGEDKANAFLWNNLKPVYAFERIGSETLKALFDNIRSGEDSWAVDMNDARAFYLEQAKKHGYGGWDMEKQHKFASSSGVEFSLNLEQIMSLYAYSKREQAHDHLLKGGFVFDGNTEVQVNKHGIKVTYLNKTAKAHNVSLEILADIVSTLTPEQKAFVDAMQEYLSATMGGKGNQVSMELYGVKLFNEQYYFPLRSAGQYMERAKEADMKKQQGQISIVNSGFAKATTPKSSNPVVLSGFMDVWADHVNEMSMYHSFVLPMEDFRRVYNYATPNTETGQSASVNAALQDAYGDAATKYIDQLYKDLNGGALSDPRENLAKRLTGQFKKAAVFASLSVVVQQPSAIGRAFALIDPRHFIGSKVDSQRHKALWAQLKRYAPVAAIKEMGYFDTGMGKSARDYIKGKEYGTLKEKAAALFKDGNYRDEVLSKAPALADELTWCAIWEAVKRETKEKNPGMGVSSEEFLQMAGKRFTEVVTKTQVYDSVLARSSNMRSKGAFMSMWTAFMAEPTTTINMVEDALRKGRKGDRKYAARAMGAVLTSVMVNSVLSSLVYAMRDDDEDETFLEKYTQSLLTEMLDGINPITYYPFLKDVWSALQGFDIERADMSLITKAVEALTKLVKVYGKDEGSRKDGELSKAWWGVVDYMTAFMGVPVKNIRRDINGAIGTVKTIFKDVTQRDTSWGSLVDKAWDAVKNNIPVVGWLPDETAADKLYDATVRGDGAYRQRLESAYSTQSALDSAIRKGLRANDSRIWEAAMCWNRNDLEGYKRIAREIVGEGHFSQDNVVMAIQAEAKAMQDATASEAESKSRGYFTAEKFAVAIAQGNGAMADTIQADMIATAQANGDTAEAARKSFASSAKSALKKLFIAGGMTAEKAMDAMVSYCDMDEEDAQDALLYWDFLSQYPQYEDLSQSAVLKYYEYVAPAGIDTAVYYEYCKQASLCESDKDADGETISGSRKAKILAVIDAMDLTKKQKNALYYANGWSKSELWKAPWN